jgi:hypothetical protein
MQKFKDEMVEVNYYANYIKLQTTVIKLEDDFRVHAIKLMSYDPNNANDPRNLIRKCPYCCEIWFKIEGCDGETICGN